jgi:hypothetical protein
MAPLPLLQIVQAVSAAVALALLAVDWTLVLKAWRAAGRPKGLWESLSYVVLQTVSAVAAMIFLPLYAAALAIHYVEYQVLMYPRCFYSRLDMKRGIDHFYQSLRGSRALFYLVLIAVSGVVTYMTTLSGLWGTGQKVVPYLAFVAIFDGIFVCHYFIEMLIWRFSDPFFRKTAAALYIAPRGRS